MQAGNVQSSQQSILMQHLEPMLPRVPTGELHPQWQHAVPLNGAEEGAAMPFDADEKTLAVRLAGIRQATSPLYSVGGQSLVVAVRRA